ncbi:hypothetical protein D3C81_2325290 [compost metagenome]
MATKPMLKAICASVTDNMPRVRFSITKKISSDTPTRISGIAIGVSTSTCSKRIL